MVDRLTLFEIHLDDARFGTNDELVADERPVETDLESSQADGPNVRRIVLASLFVSIVVTAIARRLFGEEETTEASIEIEDSDTELEIES